jgi:hypothetical protein
MRFTESGITRLLRAYVASHDQVVSDRFLPAVEAPRKHMIAPLATLKRGNVDPRRICMITASAACYAALATVCYIAKTLGCRELR